ncbi:MAG TPA: PQQ-dependent dehydrogenase, methanol/ethanol family [Bryobacteraceae bacterium]|nr:PQQ-dependent dehydrogenase, methanol/ethanol family [Bryobacteraceae bacterium]
MGFDIVVTIMFLKIIRGLAPLLLLMPIGMAQQPRRVDDTALKNAGKSGDEWLTYGFTPGETRYSPLDQLNVSNVKRLGLAWSYDLGAGGGGQEATPLVWNGTLFGITNWSVVFAVDARTGKERWRWNPEVNQEAVRPTICCGVVNRGIAIYQGMIIAPIIDGRLQALDADTGKPVWEARVAFSQDEYTITMAPRIASGKVIVGVSGGDHPKRGFFDAYDAMTGHRLWRFYTIPGDPSKPFENSAMRKASETWDPQAWKLGGGGAVWDGIAYDPDTDLVYAGTGNAEPWPEEFRGAKGKDGLYACSILAVQASTGELKWHYQLVPDDTWDFDSVQQMMLANLTINGKQRKVIMQASKNGFFYVLDRVTGEFISAQPYAKVNWAKGVDPKTGRPIVNAEARYAREPVTIFPSAGGAHNWSPMSFNPATGLVYISGNTASSWTFASVDKYEAKTDRTSNNGLVRPMPTPRENNIPLIGPEPLPGTGSRGGLIAWDPVEQKFRWRMPGGGGIGGGTLSTAGNLVFQSINDGRLMAYSADKGDKLLEMQTGLKSGVGPPITYQVDGKQYVALMGGIGTVIGNAGPQNTATTTPPKLLVYVLDGTAAAPSPADPK